MGKIKLLLFCVVCVLIPSVALADIPGAFKEFITHGDFNEITNAFERTALIFSDDGFQNLVVVFFVGAIFLWLAIAVLGGRMIGAVPAVVLMPGLVFILSGALVYISLIRETTDIAIYDPETNQHMIVAEVPQGVALIAGAQSLINEALIDMIWTSSDPESYPANAGGDIFNIFAHIFDSSSKFVPSMDDSSGQLLSKSIQSYWKACSLYAIDGPTGGFDPNILQDGSMTLIDVLAELKNSAEYVTTYLDGNTSGLSVTCTEAFGYIESELNGLTASGSGKKFFEERCGASGYYDQASATGTSAIDVCKNKTIDFLATQVPSLGDSMSLVRQVVVSQALQGYIKKYDIASLANYKIMTAATGEAVSALNWVPIIKGVVFAVYLGLIPFLLMLLPTMLFSRILQFIVGIFVFMICWNVCDAILHSYAMDRAVALMRNIFDGASNLSLLDIWLMRDESMKSLVLFGKMRWTSMMLAAVVSAVIAKYGGVALAHFAGQMNFGGLSSQAGNEILDPERRASDLQALPRTPVTEAISNQYGSMAMARDWALQQEAGIIGSGRIIAGAGGSVNSVNQMADIRSTQHNEGVGHVKGVNTVEEKTGWDAKSQAEASTEVSALSGIGKKWAADELGASTYVQGVRMQTDLSSMTAFKTDLANQIANDKFFTSGNADDRLQKNIGGNPVLASAFNSSGDVIVAATTPEQKANVAKFLNNANGTHLASGDIADSLKMTMTYNNGHLSVPYVAGQDGASWTHNHNTSMDNYGQGVSISSGAMLDALGHGRFVGSGIDVVGHKDAVIAEYARAVTTYQSEMQRGTLGYNTGIEIGLGAKDGRGRGGKVGVGYSMDKTNIMTENQVATHMRDVLSGVTDNSQAQRLMQDDWNNRLRYNEISTNMASMKDLEDAGQSAKDFVKDEFNKLTGN